MSRPKSAKPAAATLISGVRALGEALGVSHVTAGNYVKHEDWPYGRGPWTAEQVAEMKRWAGDTLRPANVPDEVGSNVARQLSGVKFQKIVRECRILDVRLKQMNGELVDRADAEADCVRKLEAVKRTLRAVPDGLPFDETIKGVVRQHIDRAFDLLSRGG